jgi:hypothetical protein
MTTVAEVTVDSAPGANGTWTTAVRIEGYFNLSISSAGTFTTATTVHVQRSIDNTTWHDVNSYTEPAQEVGFDPELIYYRAGVKNGNLNSGEQVTIRIGREDKDRH